MEKIISMILLATIVFVFNDGVHGRASDGETRYVIDRKLKALNKPAVKTIMSEDGDTIDCVDIYKQPSLDHPALKNHTVQLRPSFDLTGKVDRINKSGQPVVIQTWQKKGTCPKGTVPIRRIRREDLLRAASLEHFGRKLYTAKRKEATRISKFTHLNNTTVNPIDLSAVNRSYAVLYTFGKDYLGAQADINAWNPHVDREDDYTTAQIWVRGGPDHAESIEAGWAVNPKLYGDNRTRLFAYWTADGYNNRGCFDLTCAGFINTNTNFTIGGTFHPISTTLGEQWQINIAINRDPQTGNWWFVYQNNVVGYWPASLFNSLKQSASLVEWGGEVYSQAVKKTPHTRTAMGSGEMAYPLYGNACYIRNVKILDTSLQLKYPEWVGTWTDESSCYNAYNDLKDYEVPSFFFGGTSGRNPECQ